MKFVDMEKCFNEAKEKGAKFVGVLIDMAGFEKPEVIINSKENFDTKLDYYKKAYDEDLVHNHSKGIKIIGFTFGNSFSDIEFNLLRGKTFYEKLVDGEVIIDDIDYYIAAWHNGTSDLDLHDFLGLTETQYARFLEKNEIII